VELSSDQGPEFMADKTQDFLLRWGIKHRVSAAYNPQSNGRAELAVKSTKQLLERNIGPDGKLDTDNFLRALLIKRNTPDAECKLSPAQIIFGRNLRDALPRINKEINIFHNNHVNPTWHNAWQQKEQALRTRYQGCQERLAEHARDLPPLLLGDRVAIQNQTGRRPSKWERTGTVVEVRDHEKYVMKVDGSGRLTMRNRRFLKKLFQDNAIFKAQQVPSSMKELTPTMINDSSAELQTAPEANMQLRPRASETFTSGTGEPAPGTIDNGSDNTPCISKGQFDTSMAPQIVPQVVPNETIVQDSGRPIRSRKACKVYDASTSTYVDRNPGK